MPAAVLLVRRETRRFTHSYVDVLLTCFPSHKLTRRIESGRCASICSLVKRFLLAASKNRHRIANHVRQKNFRLSCSRFHFSNASGVTAVFLRWLRRMSTYFDSNGVPKYTMAKLMSLVGVIIVVSDTPIMFALGYHDWTILTELQRLLCGALFL